MHIGRGRGHWREGKSALEKVQFCLRKLEEAPGFTRLPEGVDANDEDDMNWDTEIVDGLIVEEMVGALLHAEEALDADSH